MLNFIITLLIAPICQNVPVEGKVVSSVFSEEKGWHGTAVVQGGFMRRYTSSDEMKRGDAVNLRELKCDK